MREGNPMFEKWKNPGKQPKKEADWTEQELDYMCSEAGLRLAGSKSMAQRAAEYSLLFNKNITAKSLR